MLAAHSRSPSPLGRHALSPPPRHGLSPPPRRAPRVCFFPAGGGSPKPVERTADGGWGIMDAAEPPLGPGLGAAGEHHDFGDPACPWAARRPREGEPMEGGASMLHMQQHGGHGSPAPAQQDFFASAAALGHAVSSAVPTPYSHALPSLAVPDLADKDALGPPPSAGLQHLHQFAPAEAWDLPQYSGRRQYYEDRRQIDFLERQRHPMQQRAPQHRQDPYYDSHSHQAAPRIRGTGAAAAVQELTLRAPAPPAEAAPPAAPASEAMMMPLSTEPPPPKGPVPSGTEFVVGGQELLADGRPRPGPGRGANHRRQPASAAAASAAVQAAASHATASQGVAMRDQSVQFNGRVSLDQSQAPSAGREFQPHPSSSSSSATVLRHKRPVETAASLAEDTSQSLAVRQLCAVSSAVAEILARAEHELSERRDCTEPEIALSLTALQKIARNAEKQYATGVLETLTMVGQPTDEDPTARARRLKQQLVEADRRVKRLRLLHEELDKPDEAATSQMLESFLRSQDVVQAHLAAQSSTEGDDAAALQEADMQAEQRRAELSQCSARLCLVDQWLGSASQRLQAAHEEVDERSRQLAAGAWENRRTPAQTLEALEPRAALFAMP
eukprot:TRINITY_DN38373_c0_g2_i2.p1 TRINITY_DN38373_c0_g2~~TRINITY_DN38373_c0_g2_i2.p1  ORF type:complete len:614 (+),score=117.67 TRINITY_DN38373_c0_g2_i2:82-1923(+)